MRTLTPQQTTDYKENGFLTGIRIAEAGEATRYRAQFDALEAAEGRDKARVGLLDRHRDTPFLWRIATHPRILDAVEALIGPDVFLMATHFFCKYGREDKFVAWHQDVTYWGLEPPTALTVWYAVDDSDAENGCMRVIPGSHTNGIREHGKSDLEGNILSVNQETPVTEAEASRAIDLPLRAGEASIHDGLLIHGSLPNRSDRRRCGLTLRYVPASVRQVAKNSHGREWSAILVCGEDRYGYFPSAAPPLFEKGGR